MVVAQTRLTLEDFLALPEEEPALEFHPDGTVTQKVSPQGKHSTLQPVVWQFFDRFARPGEVARAFTELRATFGGASRVPDVSVYLLHRIPVDAAGEVADVFTEPPDIAVEIASPDQSVTALIRKCPWFIENGVRVALIVDPVDRSVLCFRPGTEMEIRRGDDVVDVSDILPNCRFTVAELFSSLKLSRASSAS